MAKRDNKDIFENIENSEPIAESHQEESIVKNQIEIVSESDKEVVWEPEPIVIVPIVPIIATPIQPKKNPDKLRKIKNNPIKYY